MLLKATITQKKIYTLAKRDMRFRKCYAVKANGSPCRCNATVGSVFCHIHTAQGYGLFTLAVIAQLEQTAQINNME